VLPALMPDGAAGQGLRRWLAQGAGWGLRVLPALRWPVLGLGVLAVAVLGLQHGQLWRADLGALSPVPRQALALDAELRAELSASESRTLVVVQGADAQATLRAAEAAGARLDALVAQGQLAGYDSPARFLPSVAAQQARLAALPPAEALRANLATALAGSPLRADRLGAFVDEVQAARGLAPVTLAGLAGSPFKPVVEAMLVQRRSGQGWLALMPLQARDATPVPDAAVRAALADVPAAQVIDIKQELDGLYQRYLGEALWQSGLGALGVVLLLAATLRSARRVWVVCQPLALAVLLTLGGLALAGVALGILHLVGLLLVVAVGSNYALFFDQLRRAGPPDHDTLASLLLANITTVGSFGLIAASSIPALSAIGIVVAPGALLALLLSAVLVRGPAQAAVPAAAGEGA